jgi:preprotein translocase SecE subunit
MSEENKNLSVDETEEVEVEVQAPKAKSDKKHSNKKPFFLIRIFKRLGKLWKDVIGEMKKVVWTPKDELKKSTKLVLAAVVAVGLSIAVVDTFFSWIINSVAGLIG